MPPYALPKTGWTYSHAHDALGEDVRCAFCNHTLRWVHVLRHPTDPREPEVGGCCARNFCDPALIEENEREMQSRARRLANFLDPTKWRASHRNPENRVRLVGNGKRGRIRVSLFRTRLRAFSVAVVRGRGKPTYPPSTLTSESAVLEWAFDEVDRLRASEVRR